MSGALSAAYQSNPDLNQERAATRAKDEDVSRAESGYRPKVKGEAALAYRYTRVENGSVLQDKTGPSFPNSARINASANIFDGNHTTSDVQRAESKVLLSREQLRYKEQQTLQSGATAYMDVLRDIAFLDLRKNNIEVLIVRLREARARCKVGEVTATDVAQVASSLATARSNYFTAQGNLFNSIAVYHRVIGVEPRRLEAARPIDSLLPPNLLAAISMALAEEPRINMALHNVDVVSSEVHLAESALYPTLGASGHVGQSNQERGNPERNFFEGDVSGDLTVPFYKGGIDYAQVREAKERLAQAQLQAAADRDEVRAIVVSTWGELETSKVKIQSAQTAVKASETAFVGVREEARLGQRTTLDLLRALEALLEARVGLISAERDRVVASYAVMAAVGRLSARNLGLGVELYDPTIHFDLVKDKWIGLRTPDGR